MGRPPKRPVILYDDFWYRAGSWDRARRVVTKVEWHQGRAVPSGGLHRHEHDGWPRRSDSILQWSWDSRAVDQRGEVRPELDSAVVPSVRGQPGASVSVHSGVQPWELPSPVMSAQGGQALVAAERAGQADQDGRPSGAARAAIDLSVVRGVGSSTVVRASVGSYRTVIACTKLREGTTTILPRGRALQGVGLSSMRFHPIGGGPKMTKMDQKHGSRQGTHPLLDRPEIDWPCRPEYHAIISFGLAFEPEDSQYGKCRLPYVVGALSCSAMNREEGNFCRAAQK